MQQNSLTTKWTFAGKMVIMFGFTVQFILCFVILSQNNSSPSVAMTCSRMVASLIAFAFILIQILKKQNIKYQMKIIKILAVAQLLSRIVVIIILQYYTKNPSQQCFVSLSVSNALTYLDIASLVTIAALLWEFIHEDKMRNRQIESIIS